MVWIVAVLGVDSGWPWCGTCHWRRVARRDREYQLPAPTMAARYPVYAPVTLQHHALTAGTSPAKRIRRCGGSERSSQAQIDAGARRRWRCGRAKDPSPGYDRLCRLSRACQTDQGELRLGGSFSRQTCCIESAFCVIICHWRLGC
jgi:hypothetical protein